MPSTSVHLPAAVIERLDRLAAERGTSRNRIILQACEDLLAADRGAWPPGFFDDTLAQEDRRALREVGLEMEQAVVSSRLDRPVPPL